jgi:hypothetical protein
MSRKSKKDPKTDSIKNASDEREIIYDQVGVTMFTLDQNTQMNQDQAKELLGWTEPQDSSKPFKDYLFKDRYGTTVICSNNQSNRPFYKGLAERWMWEILRGNWKLNGETMIIGNTGITLDCQHRLVGFVWACQLWASDPDKWKDTWEHEPCMEAIVVTGVREDRDTVNTINTGKERSVADAIYASGLYSGVSKKSLKQLAKMTAQATSLVWKRTDKSGNSFCPNVENHDIIEFLECHPRIMESVSLIFDEDTSEKNISRFHSGGYCAGLHYLMASSSTDPSAYIDERNESAIDFSNLDKADEFWLRLASSDEIFKPTIAAFSKLANREEGISLQEREALILKSWLAYVKKGKWTAKDVSLKYVTTGEIKELNDYPMIGGIDIYDPIF